MLAAVYVVAAACEHEKYNVPWALGHDALGSEMRRNTLWVGMHVSSSWLTRRLDHNVFQRRWYMLRLLGNIWCSLDTSDAN